MKNVKVFVTNSFMNHDERKGFDDENIHHQTRKKVNNHKSVCLH